MTDPIRTHIGYAGFGDNVLRGESVNDTLFGHRGYWNALSRALGGPTLDSATERHLDDLCVAMIAPDPRIWPLKVTWLIGAYGTAWSGSAAATASFAGGFIGPAPTAEIAATYAALHAETGGDADQAAHLLDERGVRRVAGFGVAGPRTRDERVDLILAAVDRHGQPAPHCRFVSELATLLKVRRGLSPNVGLFVSAALLDRGFQPTQVSMIVYAFLALQVLGHAVESASIQHRAMKRLPNHMVRYTGPAQRPSPRASRRGGA